MRQSKLELADTTLSPISLQHHYTENEHALFIQALSLLQKHSRQNVPAILSVAQLLIEQEIDAPVVISTLLASMLSDRALSPDTVRELFGNTILHLATSLECSLSGGMYTKPRIGDTSSHVCCPPVNMAHRTTLSIALLLVDLEQMAAGEKAVNLETAHEALQTFVPLASRLNLRKIQLRLEDAAFCILKPDIYRKLQQQVEPRPALDMKILRTLKDGLRFLLERNAIKGEVQGRIKSIYSLYTKLARSDRSVQSIMDRIGLRVVVSSIPDCYKVLGIIHSHFQSIPCCFDDYISSPKKNGYQSLHTCIFPVRNICFKPAELQIRTQLMHHEAEFGVAAHSKYKDTTTHTVSTQKHRTGSLPDEFEAEESPPQDTDEYLWMLHQQIYTDNMVIYGPAGQVMHCPPNITVEQYLKKVGLEVSPQELIVINGQQSDISAFLQDTDSIEIIRPDQSMRSRKMIVGHGRQPHDATFHSPVLSMSALEIDQLQSKKSSDQQKGKRKCQY